MIQEITDTNFESEVIGSDETVIIDFYARWCKPCLAMLDVVQAYSEKYSSVKVGKVDVDANLKTTQKYTITTLPAILVFKNGAVVRKVVGNMALADLEERLGDPLLSPNHGLNGN